MISDVAKRLRQAPTVPVEKQKKTDHDWKIISRTSCEQWVMSVFRGICKNGLIYQEWLSPEFAK